MTVVRQVLAGAAQAMLAGMKAIGLDEVALAEGCGLKGVESMAFDAPLPQRVFSALWQEAYRARPEDELATRVGLAVPFGAFDTLDYLARSSPRVDATPCV